MHSAPVLIRCALATLLLALVTTACASHLPALPSNVTVGSTAAALPSPPSEANDAPPEVVAAHFSSLDIRRGQVWSGAFVTGTNVASLEVRSNLFSLDVPRTAFGRFAFSLDVFDAPSIFVRAYRLRVIARNSAGRTFEEDLPMRIR